MYENYDFGKFPPYSHQLSTLESSADKEYWAWFLEMGCGKSYICIHNIALAYQRGWINSAIIVAPKGVYMNWVYNEIPKYMPSDITYEVVNWDSAKVNTKYWQRKMTTFLNNRDPGTLRVLVVNPECFRQVRKRDSDSLLYIKEFVSQSKCFLAVDESTVIKSTKAAKTKLIIDVGTQCTMRRIMSGYPNPESPIDFVGQCYFLSPKSLGLPANLYQAWMVFRARYAILEKQFMGTKSFDVVTGYQRLDELSEKLTKFSTRLKKADCLDLPEKIYRQHVVGLSKKQIKAYNDMVRDSVTIIKHAEEEHTITAEIVLTQIIRLQQILCGFTKNNQGEIVSVDDDVIPRELALLSDLERASGSKVIIWSHLRPAIARIHQLITKEYGEDSIVLYTGGLKDSERKERVEQFQDPNSSVRFFLGQQRAGGFGITLTASDQTIFYTNEYPYETRIQAEDRNHRIGQTLPVTYTDIMVPGTVDESVRMDHHRKGDLGNKVLEGEKVTDEDEIKDTWLKHFNLIQQD